MGVWGSEWGTEWGGDLSAADWACELAQSRLLHWHPDGDLRLWMCAFAEAAGAEFDVLLEILAGYDVSTAVGDQLDVLGSIVGLPRSGYGDIRYRTLLQIQIKLLLAASREEGNWTGTTNNILEICRTYIGPSGALGIVNLPPKAFLLSLPAMPVNDLFLLLSFLTKAIFSEVLGYVLVSTGANSKWGSDAVVIAEAGKWGSASVVVAGAAKWGYVYTIGD